MLLEAPGRDKPICGLYSSLRRAIFLAYPLAAISVMISAPQTAGGMRTCVVIFERLLANYLTISMLVV